mgnify:CR=1 FL=1
MTQLMSDSNVLDSIIEGVLEDVQKRIVPMAQIREQLQSAPKLRNAYSALSKEPMRLIAEVKRSSPSKGELAVIADPVALAENYQDYKSSRKDWEQSYMEGLDLLGFKYTNRTEPFQGASGATHPVLAEAVTQFQALAYKELLPADGPVRTMVMGKSDPQKEMQAQRVKNFMNYQIMDQMKEYESDFDQMLFYLPLSGSTFKKVYYDAILQRSVSKFVPAEDLVVPYSATSLEDAEAIIHVIKISENELKKQKIIKFQILV